MAEWLVEEGIGEDRAVRLAGGVIAAARLRLHGQLVAGEIADAVLVARTAGSARGTLRFASGEEALVDRLPVSAREGAPLRAEVTRPAMAERGRFKRAHARPAPDVLPRVAPTLAASLEREGHSVKVVRDFGPEWDELLSETREGKIAFSGGSLAVVPTPAMTLIDIDGTLPSRALALAAVPALAASIARFDLAGSIGIDFPTLSEKAERRAVDQALAEALAEWPHERTAMNGFGFVQIVARLERASLLAIAAHDHAGTAARQLLRRAERIAAPGLLLITAAPAVRTKITPAWEADLARRTGRSLRFVPDSTLAPEAGFVQAIAQ